MRRFSRERAFTLVELLVVIGIIALLLFDILPSLSRARESAKRVTCASNLRQIGIVVTMYANDNKGWLPVCLRAQTSGVYSGRYMPSATVGPNVALIDPLAPPNSMQLLVPAPWGTSASKYLGGIEVFFCPSDETRRPFRSTVTAPNGVKVPGWGYFDIGGNSTNLAMSYWYWYYPNPNYGGVNSVTVPLAQELLNDRFSVKGAPTHSYIADQGWFAGSNAAAEKANEKEFPFFHKGGWNVLFLDGHAKWIRLDEVQPNVKKAGAYSPFVSLYWNQVG